MKKMLLWAIEPRNPEWGEGTLLGVGWFGWSKPDQTHLEGCVTALFKTRARALDKSHQVKGSLPRCRVVRVLVTIRQVAP